MLRHAHTMKQSLAYVTYRTYLTQKCGKWSLALIFNHTFDSGKSKPLSHHFSSIQLGGKKKKKEITSGITNLWHVWQEVEM